MMDNELFSEILEERGRQDRKWGEQNHQDMRWMTILTEEVGEVAKEILEGEITKTRAELVQVAAVAVAWLECIDRRAAQVQKTVERCRPGNHKYSFTSPYGDVGICRVCGNDYLNTLD